VKTEAGGRRQTAIKGLAAIFVAGFSISIARFGAE
jgi:hypothetical protein